MNGSVARIVEAHAQKWVPTVRGLFVEFAESLGVDFRHLRFDEELAGLPGNYVPPRGRLLLALDGDEPAGCVALRELGHDVCEMKRFWVRPAFRGIRLGRRLALQVISEARSAGYQRMRLDTLGSLTAAISLYRSLGFQEIDPYNDNSLPGVVFFELDLSTAEFPE